LIYLRLTQGHWCAIDKEDYKWLNQWKWSYQSSGDKTGYAVRCQKINGKRKKIYMHRFIMKCPTGLVVDHWDRNGLNNRRCNLRRVTVQANNLNKIHPGGTSKYRGVRKSKKRKYRATVYFNGNEIHVGMFNEEIEAAKAYDAKAFEMFCEFAQLNFPEEYEARIPSEAIPF